MSLTMTHPNRAELRNSVLTALERLRAVFPLEQRLTAVDAEARRGYAAILRTWLGGGVPQAQDVPAAVLATLQQIDAVVATDTGLGCYPFSARTTGISVALPHATVAAMCAIDALAIARLAGACAWVSGLCVQCHGPIRCRVEDNGGLDHDQTDVARIVWLAAINPAASCSQGLCRALRFLCPNCHAPTGSECFTLPQATAIGNAFFAFQRVLLQTQTRIAT